MFAAVVVSSPSCTKRIGSDFLALPGNANGTYNTNGSTSIAIGPAPYHNTARLTASTARCESGPPTANFHGPGATYSSLPGTASSRVVSSSATSALQRFPPGRTSGTRPAMVSGDWANSSRLDGQLFSQLYIVRFLDDPGPIKINLLPSAYTTSRSAVLVSPASSNWGLGSRRATERRWSP